MDVAKLKEKLIKERNNKTKGSIYHYCQVVFSYNSNKIEGSKLSSEQTESIFNNKTIENNDNDVIETRNHFRLFDFMLDSINENLSISLILKMHSILKENGGKFKNKPNVIGVVNEIKTVSPLKVETELYKLIEWYNSKTHVSIEDIIEFHYRFECIHPFDDGNGRIGRMIMFRECLINNIVPFIILDSDKIYYLRGLNKYKKDKLFLIDTIGHEQDIFVLACEDMI